MTTTTATKKPATVPQTDFLRNLLAERAGNPEAEKVREMLNAIRGAQGYVHGEMASAAIERLLEIPKPAPKLDVDVPAGRYAVEHNGTLKFYKVDRPTEGKWAGWTFLKVMASDNEFPVRGAAQAEVMGLIAADPTTAMRRFGTEIGKCGRCHRTLTDETSRAFGIGPDCREILGW